MVNRIRFILVILMGIMCLTGCSAEKEALPPCPFGFTDWVGGAPNLETERLKQASETLGKAKEKIDDVARDSTELENCVKARCRKDAKCIEKELARAKSAWFWGMVNFFAVQPWDMIIMIMLIILILKKWPMPYPPERRYHNAVLWTFLTFFVPLVLIAIFIRGDSLWATAFWWLSLIILCFIFIKQKQKKYASDLEYEDEDEEEEDEPCPFCGGNKCGPYCEQHMCLLPGYEDPDPEKGPNKGVPGKPKNPAGKYR